MQLDTFMTKGLPFDELRKAIRIKEEDQKKRDEKKKEYSNTVTASGKSEIDELKDMIQNMNTEMKQMKEELSTSTMDNTDQYVNSQQHFNADSYGHYGHYRQRGYYGRNYRRGYNGRRSRDEGLVEDLHSSNSIKMKQLTTCTRNRDIQRMEILYV